ncbi:hypothetical protein [Winogradskya humida]
MDATYATWWLYAYRPDTGRHSCVTEEILRVFFASPPCRTSLGNGSNSAAIEQQTDLRPLFRRHALDAEASVGGLIVSVRAAAGTGLDDPRLSPQVGELELRFDKVPDRGSRGTKRSSSIRPSSPAGPLEPSPCWMSSPCS